MSQTNPEPRTSNPESFATLIRAMESLLERLLAVSERQLMFVQNEDEELLNQLLGHKAKLFDERERISRLLDPYRDIPEEERRWNSETEKKETQAARDHCAQLLQEILRLDDQSLQVRSQQMETLKAKLRQVRQGGRLHEVYSKQKK